MARPERVVLTYEDYLQLPEDRNRYELFEGELEVTAAPAINHQRVVTRLASRLDSHVAQRRLGEVFVAPTDVLLSDLTVLQPDVLFISHEHREIIQEAYIKGPPDLVIEVISPATAKRDRQTKRKLYARYGVPYYWLADPAHRRIEASVLDGADYRLIARGKGDEIFSASPFPDLAIPLGELWT
ncbi:MAG: Uma2 family endonuclease [Chloroflexi bacterium]|nr:Uma2 family endonuclease [Chloroflexota bacterium]